MKDLFKYILDKSFMPWRGCYQIESLRDLLSAFNLDEVALLLTTAEKGEIALADVIAWADEVAKAKAAPEGGVSCA